MAVNNLYSNRLQPKTEKLEYDIFPNELRIQLVYIWEHFFHKDIIQRKYQTDVLMRL
jgi:hypothetical protein